MTRFTDLKRKLIRAMTRVYRVRVFVLFGAVSAMAIAQEVFGVRMPFSIDDPNAQKAYGWVVAIVMMIASAVISYALQPKPPNARPAALTDFDVPTAEEGRPIPVIFGTVWIKGPNVLWYGDLSMTPIKSKSGK